ncbi:hypothetical protein PENSPDRAFT_571079 [Peniophora sp. CONT]|nr:hypothetical protein PENSPDRAFT_571079 [Peniophora sp. CONT]
MATTYEQTSWVTNNQTCIVPGCDKPAPNQCSVCRCVKYCSAECQAADWKTHKRYCKQFEKQREDNIQKRLDEAMEKPDKKVCTGCNTRFRRDYPIDQECPDCGYVACEDCSCHHSRGTCECPNSNFGSPYCNRQPAWYHGARGRRYDGDYHPEGYNLGPETDPDLYEAEPRTCDNCGLRKFCLSPAGVQELSRMF